MSCGVDESESEALAREAEAEAGVCCQPGGPCSSGCSRGTGASSGTGQSTLGGGFVGGHGGAGARRQCVKCKARAAQARVCPRQKQTSVLLATDSDACSVFVHLQASWLHGSGHACIHFGALFMIQVLHTHLSLSGKIGKTECICRFQSLACFQQASCMYARQQAHRAPLCRCWFGRATRFAASVLQTCCSSPSGGPSALRA